MLKKRGGKDFDKASTSGKSDQVGAVEEADENLCDVLTAQMFGYLTQGAHNTCAQKGSGSVHTSLSMEVLS